MTRRQREYDVVPFPPLQHQMMDWLALMHRQHTIHGLIEVDVTDTRRAIRAYRARTGLPLSLTAFIIFCLARAIDADKSMHAYRRGRRRLILFADVDVTVVVEREVDGAKVPVPHIIRAANTKSVGQIQHEIRAAQEKKPEAVAGRSLPLWLHAVFMRGLPLWLLLPAAARRTVWAWALRNPYRRKRLTGTVGVTAVGMFGHGAGWGITPNAYTLGLVIGGLARRPRVGGEHGEHMEEREYLCLTLSLDHDVVDGAPAARFTRRLTELIERGSGLHDPI